MLKAFIEELARAAPWVILGMVLAGVAEAIGRAAGWL